MDILKQSVATGVPMTELMQQTQVAETPEQQQEGLRNQPEGTTMIFPESTGNFNTVGMDYPINIQKVSPQGDLVRSYENVPPGVESLPMGDDVGTVIETPAEYQDGGFDAWRKALPPNLRDTDTTTYNLRGAYEAGLTPEIAEDGSYHLGSVNPKTLEFLKASDHKSVKEEIAWFKNQKHTKPLLGSIHPSTHKIVKDPSGYFGERSLKYVKKQEGDFKEEEVVDYGMLPEVTVTDRDPHRNKYNRSILTGPFNALKTKARQNWAKNLVPVGYGFELHGKEGVLNTILQTALGNEDPRYKDTASYGDAVKRHLDRFPMKKEGWRVERADLLNMLMGESQKYGSIPVSDYQIEGDPTTYYSSPVTEKEIREEIEKSKDNSEEYWKNHKINVSGVLGNYTTTLGEDEKGKYIDYEDVWDLNPAAGARQWEFPLNILHQKLGRGGVDKLVTGVGEKVLGFTPPKIRGRVYFKQEGDFQEDNPAYLEAVKAAENKEDFTRPSKSWFPPEGKKPSSFAGKVIDMLPTSVKMGVAKVQPFIEKYVVTPSLINQGYKVINNLAGGTYDGSFKFPGGMPICYGNTCVQSTSEILQRAGMWEGKLEQDNDAFAQNYKSHGYKIVQEEEALPGDIVQFYKGTHDNRDYSHMGIHGKGGQYFNDGYFDKPWHKKNEPTTTELMENSRNPLTNKAIGKVYYRYIGK